MANISIDLATSHTSPNWDNKAEVIEISHNAALFFPQPHTFLGWSSPFSYSENTLDQVGLFSRGALKTRSNSYTGELLTITRMGIAFLYSSLSWHFLISFPKAITGSAVDT